VEAEKKSDNMEEEFGDLLFSLINYSRFVDINPENALAKTNNKFKARFQLMEKYILEEGWKISELGLEKLDIYWEKAKLELRQNS